jgi:hypothetical protein
MMSEEAKVDRACECKVSCGVRTGIQPSSGRIYKNLLELLFLPNIISEQGGEEALLTDDMGEECVTGKTPDFSRSLQWNHRCVCSYRSRIKVWGC